MPNTILKIKEYGDDDVINTFKIGDYICGVLEQKGMEKTELADKMGVNPKTLWGWLKRNSIKDMYLLEIACILNISLDDLKHRLFFKTKNYTYNNNSNTITNEQNIQQQEIAITSNIESSDEDECIITVLKTKNDTIETPPPQEKPKIIRKRRNRQILKRNIHSCDAASTIKQLIYSYKEYIPNIREITNRKFGFDNAIVYWERQNIYYETLNQV